MAQLPPDGSTREEWEAWVAKEMADVPKNAQCPHCGSKKDLVKEIETGDIWCQVCCAIC